jgi:hypothetical protein
VQPVADWSSYIHRLNSRTLHITNNDQFTYFVKKTKKIIGTVLPQIGPAAAETTPTATAATPAWETEATKAEATVKASMEAGTVEAAMEGHSLMGCY